MKRSFCLIGLLALAGCTEAPPAKTTAPAPSASTSEQVSAQYTLLVPNMT